MAVISAEDERKNQQVKKLYVAVIIILILMFIGIFVYSLDKVLAMEGSFPGMFTTLTESEIDDPGDNTAAAIGLLSDSVNKAVELKPQVSESRSFSFVFSEDRDDGKGGTENVSLYETDASDELSGVIKFLKSDIESALEDSYVCGSASFGENIKDVLRIPVLTDEDVISSECTYKYYQCASCGETSAESKENCEACGYAFPYTLKYRDEYTVSLEIAPSERIANLFGNLTPDDIKDILDEKLEGFAEINSVATDDFRYFISFGVNRISGNISYYEYRKEMTASAALTLTGIYSEIGSFSVSDKLVERNRFSFTWPGLKLSANEFSVEPGKSDNLLATLTCDDPTAYTIVWTSSDPDVVTVDDEGYFKAHKKADGKSAVITASFEFGGETYSDECTVTVHVLVESMQLNKRNLKLAPGETYKLIPTVSPKEATFKEVVGWFSSDESVATVANDGTVTAVAPGSAVISTYSSDGYYKSTCEVTVK